MFATRIRTNQTNQTNIMFTGKCPPHMLILLCMFWTVTSCQNKTGQHDDCSSGCGTILPSAYKEKLIAQTEPGKQFHAILDFYTRTPDRCHNMIVRPVIEYLFNIAYGNQSTDSLVISFLEQLSGERTLTIENRTRNLFSIAAYYIYAQRNTSESLIYLNKAKEGHEQMNDTLLKTYYSLMGQIRLQQTNLPDASAYYLKTITLCEKIKDNGGLAANFSNYGSVFSRMGDHVKSVEMKLKATAFFAAQHNDYNLLIGHTGIGGKYGELCRYDSAIFYYFKAIALTHKVTGNPNVEFDLYLSLGGICMGKNDFKQARYFYSKARETLNRLKDEDYERVYTMASAPAFATARNVTEEINKIKSYIPLFFNNNIASAKDACYCLYHIFYLQDKNDLVLHYHAIYDALKDILAAESNNQYVAEIETRYETQKKELKIEVQSKELKQKNALNGFLLALLGTAVMAAAFILTRLKLKRNKKDAELQQKFMRQLIENTEEERVRIARDLHDGVSQELLVLKHQIRNNHEHTYEKIDFIINEIRMISRDLYPVMLDKIGLKSSIEHICEQMMQHNLLFITTEINDNGGLDKAAALQLFRMIQEALNNVVKYAGAEAARVTLKQTDKIVVAEIMDNGKGFDVQAALNSKTSFGLLSLTERSKALHGKTEITSGPSGTLVKIEIPKSHV